MANVAASLQQLGLGEYTVPLANDGWNDIAFLRTLSDEELEAVAASVQMKPPQILKFVQHFGTGHATLSSVDQINAGQGNANAMMMMKGKGKGNFKGKFNAMMKGGGFWPWWPGWWPGWGGWDGGWDGGWGGNFPGCFEGGGCEGGFKGKGKGKILPERRPGSKYDPDADLKGKPGPNGETNGRWSFESNGAGARKKWKWKPDITPEERAAKRAKKQAEEELKSLSQAIGGNFGMH